MSLSILNGTQDEWKNVPDHHSMTEVSKAGLQDFLFSAVINSGSWRPRGEEGDWVIDCCYREPYELLKWKMMMGNSLNVFALPSTALERA